MCSKRLCKVKPTSEHGACRLGMPDMCKLSSSLCYKTTIAVLKFNTKHEHVPGEPPLILHAFNDLFTCETCAHGDCRKVLTNTFYLKPDAPRSPVADPARPMSKSVSVMPEAPASLVPCHSQTSWMDSSVGSSGWKTRPWRPCARDNLGGL